MTFWKTKEDCNAYYSQVKPMMEFQKRQHLCEGELERTEYTLAMFRID
jgi:hypothetical protein